MRTVAELGSFSYLCSDYLLHNPEMSLLNILIPIVVGLHIALVVWLAYRFRAELLAF